MAGTTHRSFGYLRRLPSKRWQASYVGPDTQRYKAPTTYLAKIDAEGWLADRKREIDAGLWRPGGAPAADAPTPTLFGPYAAAWLAGRDLKPRTRSHYAALLEGQILPTFAKTPVKFIDPPMIRAWHASLAANGTPTLRAHSYSLLRAILKDAVPDGLLASNPAVIRGAGNAKRARKIKPATLEELAIIVEAMPAKYRAMVLAAAWCALRFGELAELRRSDVDLVKGKISIGRGVVRVPTATTRPDGSTIKGTVVLVDTPKTESSVRDVSIPPHLVPVLREHLERHTAWGRDGLLFPAAGDPTQHLAPSTLYKSYYPARIKAGRPDLAFHHLRHTGAVLAASTGATLAELMARLGHSTAGAALRYQHAAQDRDAIIAAKLSELAAGR